MRMQWNKKQALVWVLGGISIVGMSAGLGMAAKAIGVQPPGQIQDELEEAVESDEDEADDDIEMAVEEDEPLEVPEIEDAEEPAEADDVAEVAVVESVFQFEPAAPPADVLFLDSRATFEAKASKANSEAAKRRFALERDLLNAISKHRTAKGDKSELRASVVKSVQGIFDDRLADQQKRLDDLRSQADAIEKQIARRRELGKDIVERRVRELLGEKDDLSWDDQPETVINWQFSSGDIARGAAARPSLERNVNGWPVPPTIASPASVAERFREDKDHPEVAADRYREVRDQARSAADVGTQVTRELSILNSLKEKAEKEAAKATKAKIQALEAEKEKLQEILKQTQKTLEKQALERNKSQERQDSNGR